MSPTHDMIIDNSTGANVRADINNALAALVSNSSSSSEPATKYAYMWWADTTTGILKIRNSANNAWVELFQLDGTLTLEDGSASTPALAFRDDLNTGMYQDGNDIINFSTSGVERLELSGTATVFNEDGADVDFRIEGDTEANLFYVDAGNDRIGIGTSSPSFSLDVNGSMRIGDGNVGRRIQFSRSGLGDELVIGVDGTGVGSANDAVIQSSPSFGRPLIFGTNNSERMRIDSSGRLLIGTTTEGFSSADDLTIATTGNTGITIRSGTSNTGNIYFSDGTSGDTEYQGFIEYDHSANFLRFATAATQRMRIDSSGNVGIGTTSPSQKLDVDGNLKLPDDMAVLFGVSDMAYVRGKDSTDGFLKLGTSGLERMRIDSSGDIFIGKTASDVNDTGVELMQNGESAFTRNNGSTCKFNRGTNNGILISLRRSGIEGGTIGITTTSASFNTSSSDRSLKKNFEAWTENTLDLFKKLNPQKFNYIVEDDGAEKTKGYIAQDLIDSFPEAYPKNDDGKYLFNPSGMVVYLMKAIQELQAKVETLEAA